MLFNKEVICYNGMKAWWMVGERGDYWTNRGVKGYSIQNQLEHFCF